jgi:hypothetical protein
MRFRKDWQGFLDSFDGPITMENSDMNVTSDDSDLHRASNRQTQRW